MNDGELVLVTKTSAAQPRRSSWKGGGWQDRTSRWTRWSSPRWASPCHRSWSCCSPWSPWCSWSDCSWSDCSWSDCSWRCPPPRWRWTEMEMEMLWCQVLRGCRGWWGRWRERSRTWFAALEPPQSFLGKKREEEETSWVLFEKRV